MHFSDKLQHCCLELAEDLSDEVDIARGQGLEDSSDDDSSSNDDTINDLDDGEALFKMLLLCN